MNLRRVDLNLLTVFDAVMAEGNLTRAADKIGMSQPAISLALSRLRHLVGDELFIRSGRGVRPTRRALELMPPVRQALDLITASLEEREQFDYVRSERVFNVVLGEYGDTLLLPTIIKTISDARSAVRINLPAKAELDIRKELRFGALDLVLWVEPLQGNDVRSELIDMDGHVCLVRKGHPASKQRLTMKRYVQLDHIIFDMPEYYGQTMIDRIIHAQGHERRVACRFHSYFQVPAILSASDFVCTLPTRLAQHLSSRYPLQILEAPFTIDMPLYLNWSTARDSDPGHIWLREQVANACN